MRINHLAPSFLLAACAAILPAQTFTLVHVFHGADGANPSSAGLVEDSNGNLYSTTEFGGASGLGTIYKIDQKTNNKETVLHSFNNSTDGEGPYTGVIFGADGNLYGTAPESGANGVGTLFRSTINGAFSVLYQFQGGSQAGLPGMLLAGSNALYGVAGGGAPFNAGMVYSLTSDGENDLYKFVGGADGTNPGHLVRDSAGNFYGTAGGGDLTCTSYGACGVLFKIDAKGIYSVLHVFLGLDGNGPSGLTIDTAGNLYGTTVSGGAHDAGTVFKFTPNGQLITLYSFTGGTDGRFPQAGVVRDSAGNLYGTTSSGGVASSQCFNQPCGVVFMLQPTTSGTWKESVLHTFNGADGSQPSGPLLLDPSQPALYGTASTGGDFSCTTIAGGSSCGVVFKITR